VFCKLAMLEAQALRRRDTAAKKKGESALTPKKGIDRNIIPCVADVSKPVPLPAGLRRSIDFTAPETSREQRCTHGLFRPDGYE